MYVELSARRTGKSTRLLFAILKWIRANPKNIAILVTYNQHMAHMLKDQIKKLVSIYEYNTIKSQINYKELSEIELRKIPKQYVARFYDEFDFFPNKIEIDIHENNYYVTTLAVSLDLEKMHDMKYAPITMQLIRANNFYFESYVHYEGIQQDWADSLDIVKFEIENGGKIFIQDDVSEVTNCFYEN